MPTTAPSTVRLAVVPVRGGKAVAGGLEAVAECDGRAVFIGQGAVAAATAAGHGTIAVAVEVDTFDAGIWADALVPLLTAPVVVLPASPDGRDLAPRLAHVLGRPLLAGAIAVHERGAALARHGGLVIEDTVVDEPFVATLQPGVRGVAPTTGTADVTSLDLGEVSPATSAPERGLEVLEVLPPDVATMDLAEAHRIVGGGAGLDSEDRFEQLAAVGRAIGASMGATRVVTDRGWVEHTRQIGTTGVVVDPRLYLAFGISGAVQHTSGLGQPDHIVSVNLEPHCPMMQLADLAIVSDANAVVAELAARLRVEAPTASHR